MADVFISYKREDRKQAEALAEFLKANGYSVWWDTSLLAGETFTEVIQAELDAARKVIVLWSSAAAASRWVRAEASRALDQDKLIPVQLEPCKLPLPFTELHTLPVNEVPADFQHLLAPLRGQSKSSAQWRAAAFSATPKTAMHLPNRAAVVKTLLALLVVAGGGMLLFGLRQMLRVPGPQWQLSRETFIGEPIPLQWSYAARKTSNAPVSFLVEHDADRGFASADKVAFYTEGAQRPVGHINGARYWRIRAVDDHDKHPLSDWSAARRLTQYDSAYRRVEATSTAIIAVSDTDYDDVFKWKDKGWNGFDIALVQAVVDELSVRVGWHLDRRIVAVPWKELLSQPWLGGADLIVSAISKREERERDYKLSFSDTYFCTTQALLFRTGDSPGPVAQMIAGRRLGYQEHTTTEKVVRALEREHRFVKRAFDRPETMLNALLTNEIDLALVDAPFAADAQRSTRQRAADRLQFKQLSAADFPETIAEKDRYDEYAIGVHAGDELLGPVNDILRRFKTEGTIDRLFQASAREFARAKGTGAAEANPLWRERVWQCAH